ncbi:MAG: ABC transporter permease [bacterium]|nr:ABC transporter permease [bacterium]
MGMVLGIAGALLYLPLLAVSVYSVNATRLGLVWKGFTLSWYLRLFQDELILNAAWNTLVLASVSTAIATLLGTCLALGLERFPWKKRVQWTLDTWVDLPIVTPDIIFAAALVVAFGTIREVWGDYQSGMVSMVIGHVTFQIAFVALIVRSRIVTVGNVFREAASDLYATPRELFRRVTLPLILPGVLAGATLAFMLSLDDFVISFFTSGPKSDTLPIFIYASLRRGLSPELHALSTLIVLITVILVLGLQKLTRTPTEE